MLKAIIAVCLLAGAACVAALYVIHGWAGAAVGLGIFGFSALINFVATR